METNEEEQRDIEISFNKLFEAFKKSQLDRISRSYENLRGEMKDNLLMLLPGTIIAAGLLCGSLGYLGKVGYDYFKHKHSLKKNVESVEKINTSEVRLTQEGSEKNIIKYLDYKPFGSLDEAVRIENGKPEILRVGDKGFNEYLQNWQTQIK